MPETTTLDNLRRIMDETALWILEQQRDVPLVPETVLADIGMSASDTLELMLACEEEFGIGVTDEEADALVTVGDVVRLIESKVNDVA